MGSEQPRRRVVVEDVRGITVSWRDENTVLASQQRRDGRLCWCTWDTDSGEISSPIDGPRATFSGDGQRFVLRDRGMIRLQRTADRQVLRTMVSLQGDKYVNISPDGHYYAAPKAERELVYIALTESGEQLTLTPDEFAKKYGWKNDATKVGIGKSEVGREGKAES